MTNDPKDIYHSQSNYLSSGLLTPSTPVYEGRRDSIASAQSSMSYAPSYSSGSFYSPKMPPTPTSQRDHAADDFTFVHATSSFDGTAASVGEDAFGGCLVGVSASMSQSMRGIDSHSPFPNDWVFVRQEHQHPIRQETLQSNVSLPAAGDLPSAFNALLGPQAQSPSSVRGLSDSNSWSIYSNNVHDIPDVAPHDLGYSYAPPLGASNDVHVDQWPTSTSGQIFSCIGATETIRPANAVFDMEPSLMQMDSDSFDESFDSYGTCSSPMLHSQQDSYPDIPTEDYAPVKNEDSDADEHDVKLPRRMYVSPTGGKGVKKERGISKKKSLRGKHKSFISKLHSGDVQVDVEFERDSEGNYYCPEGRGQKQNFCEHAGCDKKFARPEHLKRHEQTHANEKLYCCVVCEKPFNRNDNCLAHYLTHVQKKDGKAKRNKQYPLSEMERMIRQSMRERRSQEEGEKIIEWIQNKILGEGDQKPSKLAVRASL